MSQMVDRAGLSVAGELASFIDEQALPSLAIQADAFWRGLADIYARFTPDNCRLLKLRDEIQAKIDAWHEQRRGQPYDAGAYQAFLTEIGYLVPEPGPFTVDPQNFDEVIAAGPQLVVPVLNARFLLNAASARWGSLYDALYGTDAIVRRRARRAAMTRPASQCHRLYQGVLGRCGAAGARPPCRRQRLCSEGRRAVAAAGQSGGVRCLPRHPANPSTILLRNNGLHVELVLDRGHSIGKDVPAGLADVVLEAALTTIVDLEDSVAAVDGSDEVATYANWLGLMRGTLQASFAKGGNMLTRKLKADRDYTAPDGSTLTLPGRSLLFVRNVGHLMTTPVIRLPDRSDAPEGILDGVVTSLVALHNRGDNAQYRSSRKGSIYIVKLKMHGPDEIEFANRLFDAVEDLLGLARHTIKVGVMDRERWRPRAGVCAGRPQPIRRIADLQTRQIEVRPDRVAKGEAGAVARPPPCNLPFHKRESSGGRLGDAMFVYGRAEMTRTIRRAGEQ